MKIFSLQSKWALAGWSVVLGAVLDYLITSQTYEGMSCLAVVGTRCPLAEAGWPFKIGIWQQADYYNLWNFLFWILITLIILTLIRYFKYKN